MTMTAVEHRQMLDFADALRVALNAAAEIRYKRDATIPTRYGTEPAWAVYERDLLYRMVNDRRAELDADMPATEDEVYAVEQSASGHSDYAHKYTLRLAFLAYGMEWQP